MRNVLRSVALAAAIIPIAFSARGASAQVAGVWEAAVPTQTRVENGVTTQADPVMITITLEARGDSIFGTWARGAIEGRPAVPPRKLAGVYKDGVLTLKAEPQEARMMRNDEEQIMKIISTYTLKLEADALTGTQTVTSEDGSMPPSERPFTAKRKKA